MSPTEFEPTISAGGRPQTYALDRAATGTIIIIIVCTLDIDVFCGYFVPDVSPKMRH